MQQRMFNADRRDDGRPLVEVLAVHFTMSRRAAKALLDRRAVFVNGRRVWMARHSVRAGDRIEAQAAPEARAAAVEVLLDADGVVVANKPPGLLSEGAGSLEIVLRRQLDRPNLVAVHRLDRDTSGCLLLADDPELRDLFIPRFRDRQIGKVYRAIAAGRVRADLRRIARPLEGRPAATAVTVLDTGEQASHLRLAIETGRTHQIRRHLAAIGHPVLGDHDYTPAALPDPRLRAVPRQMLHAESLAFEHPRTGAALRCRAPLPSDFRRCLDAFGLH